MRRLSALAQAVATLAVMLPPAPRPLSRTYRLMRGISWIEGFSSRSSQLLVLLNLARTRRIRAADQSRNDLDQVVPDVRFYSRPPQHVSCMGRLLNAVFPSIFSSILLGGSQENEGRRNHPDMPCASPLAARFPLTCRNGRGSIIRREFRSLRLSTFRFWIPGTKLREGVSAPDMARRFFLV